MDQAGHDLACRIASADRDAPEFEMRIFLQRHFDIETGIGLGRQHRENLRPRSCTQCQTQTVEAG